MIKEGKIIGRVAGVVGNVTVRGFIKSPDGSDICQIYTKDEQLLYVDAKLVEIMEV